MPENINQNYFRFTIEWIISILGTCRSKCVRPVNTSENITKVCYGVLIKKKNNLIYVGWNPGCSLHIKSDMTEKWSIISVLITWFAVLFYICDDHIWSTKVDEVDVTRVGKAVKRYKEKLFIMSCSAIYVQHWNIFKLKSLRTNISESFLPWL